MPDRAGAIVPEIRAILDDPELVQLEGWVRANFGIHFTTEQRELFATRVAAHCRDTGGTLGQCLARVVGGDRAATLRLAEAVSTNHTLFFREGDLFTYLETEILPRLPEGPIRVWSAAASSGDEAYSLAITFAEQLGSLARVRVLGTDLSERQVRAAEQGVYPMIQLQQVSPARRARWFRPAGLGQFKLVDELRAACTFRRLNLTQQPWPFEQRFHVTFLRNVLYYFEPSTRRRVVEACFDAAEPGGWLVTSVTEPMLDLITRWTPVRPGVYRRGPG